MELRTLLDWVVAYRLRSVPGVIEVNTMGGEVKQYQVVLDPRKMAGFKLTLREVLTALQQNNTNVGGGYIETQRRADRHPRRGAVQGRRGHRRHGARGRRRRHAHAAAARRRRSDRPGAALRRRHHARQGRDRRRHGDDADRRELARGGQERQGAARGDPDGAAGGRRDPSVLRPRGVHRSDADDGRRSTWRRAPRWSSRCCS